jgi:hypothetical protein
MGKNQDPRSEDKHPGSDTLQLSTVLLSKVALAHRSTQPLLEKISVADPDRNSDPDPSDPYVFGPPGSGSISQRYGSGSVSFYHQPKITINTLIFTVL